MFNLLQGIECVEGRYSFSLSRIYSDDAPMPSSVEEFDERARLPSLVMEEGAPLNGNLAYFVKLSDFAIHGKDISFDL